MRLTFISLKKRYMKWRITPIIKLRYVKANGERGPISFQIFGYLITVWVRKAWNMLWFVFSRIGNSYILVWIASLVQRTLLSCAAERQRAVPTTGALLLLCLLIDGSWFPLWGSHTTYYYYQLPPDQMVAVYFNGTFSSLPAFKNLD